MWNIVTFSVSILAFIARQPRMILVDWIKHFDLLSTEMPVPVARLYKTVICRKIRLSCFRWDIRTVLHRFLLLTRSYHLSLAVLLAVIKDKTPQQFLYLLSYTLYFLPGQSKSPRHLCHTMNGTGITYHPLNLACHKYSPWLLGPNNSSPNIRTLCHDCIIL